MRKALEGALDRAEYVIESARQRPPPRKDSSSGGRSLHEKLYDIYVEECGKEPEVTEELISNVNLLEKLLMRESLSCLVVNLYPGKEGYSLMLKGLDGSYSETIRLPYEEGELLEYLDAEELPPVLLDLLEKCPVNMFHSGCVIAEIRDYRQSSNTEGPGYQSRHILLRPTMQTLACDVESITSDNQKWTQEDKLLLESQLILATAEPLCLEPSVSVACTANRLLYNKQKMNTYPMRKSLKRYSAASLSRQQKLIDFLQKSKESKAGLRISEAGNCVDTWKQRPCDLEVPSEVDVEKYAKGGRSVKYDDTEPTVWPAQESDDASLFGCEAGDRSQTTKLTFVQPLSDSLFYGQSKSRQEATCETPLSHPHSSPDDHSNSLMPALKTDAGKVVGGSEELLQKNTERPVQTSLSSSGSASLSQLSPGKEAEQPQATSSVLGKGVKHIPPATRLPWSSGKSSSGNSFTPQQASPFPKPPFPAPASEAPGLAQKSSVEVNPVSTLPAATLFPASSSLRALVTQVKANYAGLKVIKVVSPVVGTQTVVRRSNPVQRSTVGARDPSGVNASRLSSGGQPPNAQSAAPQAPSPTGAQYILKPASDLRPLTLLQVPPGSVILNTQQQARQPQQWLCQVIPGQQHQWPSTSHCQQPVSQGSSAQDSTRQNPASSAQHAVVVNLSEMGRGRGRILQARATVLCQLGSAQRRPGQNLPQQTVLLSAVQQQQQQQLQQQQQQQQQQDVSLGPIYQYSISAAVSSTHYAFNKNLVNLFYFTMLIISPRKENFFL
uniref:Spt20-like SEP domain-containing protein n=1 Tax=Rhinolophus ferrumequinum TaxID=59479 RepID=A0A671DSS1_RHIFE